MSSRRQLLVVLVGLALGTAVLGAASGVSRMLRAIRMQNERLETVGGVRDSRAAQLWSEAERAAFDDVISSVGLLLLALAGLLALDDRSRMREDAQAQPLDRPE